MKKHYIILFFIILTSCINSQWISNFSGVTPGHVILQNAHGTDITVDNNGFCYITGYVNEGSGNDILIVKYNSQLGDTIWARTYNGSAGGEDIGNKIAVDQFGNVYVVGSVTNTASSIDLVVVKLSSDGELKWARTYFNSQVSAEDSGADIALDGNGFIYVTGFSTGIDYKTDIVTIKYSSDGSQIWAKNYDGDENLEAKGSCLAVNSQGNGIYIAGYITTTTGKSDLALIKYDKNGNRVYTRIVTGFNENDRAFGIAVDEYNNVYVTGYVSLDAPGLNTDCVTMKYNSTGSLLWQQSFGGASGQADRAFGIAVDSDGYVYIVGYTTNGAGNSDYLLAAYNHGGGLVYNRSFDGALGGNDEASAIGIVTNQNNTQSIVITGSSMGTDNNYDYVTIWFDKATGMQQYSNVYSMNSQTNDVAMALATDNENRTFITGYSELMGTGPGASSFASTAMLPQFRGLRPKSNNSNSNPTGFSLSQNYPNPFNPSTVISFTLPENSNVKIVLYDAAGSVVSTLVNGFYKQGSYEVTFGAGDLASGVYFYELASGNFRDVKKMTLIK